MLSYDDIKRYYPEPNRHIGGGCDGSVNQCAIRMSMALRKAGLSFDKYTGPTSRGGAELYAKGAESLAYYMVKARPC